MKFSGTVTLQYDTPFSPFKVTEYESALDWLKESGFDGAEVCISNYNGIDVHKVKSDLDKRGLGCSTISTGQARGLENISLLHQGEALRTAQERMKQHVDAASVLGCKVTLGLLRGLGTRGNEQEEKEILARNLQPGISSWLIPCSWTNLKYPRNRVHIIWFSFFAFSSEILPSATRSLHM